MIKNKIYQELHLTDLELHKWYVLRSDWFATGKYRYYGHTNSNHVFMSEYYQELIVRSSHKIQILPYE